MLGLVRRRSMTGVAVAAAAVGLVAAPTGGAIGFPFLSRTGWSLRAGGGVLAAIAGLVLLAVGTTEAARAVRGGWRRLLGVPAALLRRRVELWVVHGAGLTDGLRSRLADWEARVVAFLDAPESGAVIATRCREEGRRSLPGGSIVPNDSGAVPGRRARWFTACGRPSRRSQRRRGAHE